MDRADVVIIGAGFAGAATACFLARRGIRNIVLIEMESSPGQHSSGRNAAMIRQLVHDPAIAALAREGAAFIHNMPPSWREKVSYYQNGSLLLGGDNALGALKEDVQTATAAGIDARMVGLHECLAIAPWMEGDDVQGGAWCPGDGVIDIAAYLRAYVDEAVELGVRIQYDCRVTGIAANVVETSQGPIEAKIIVNAAGAWAGVVGRMAGAAPIALTPFRRHLFVSDEMAGIDPRWPFVWDVEHEAYFRPESPGLLLCACDEDAAEPGAEAEHPEAPFWLAEKMIATFPKLADISISRYWAGLRTMAPDHRFVIGWDTRRKGFFWVAGLGGHGVTTCAAIGNLAARLISAGKGAREEPWDPRRFP